MKTPLKRSPIHTSRYPLESMAQKIILERQGIYKGNLIYWIKNKVPKATTDDINLAFLKLIKQGYLFTISNTIYSPGAIDHKEKDLMIFKYKNNLSLIDYGILIELYKSKRTIKCLDELSRIVLSYYWHNNEWDIKVHIQKLFIQNIIVDDDGLILNWKLIRRCI